MSSYQNFIKQFEKSVEASGRNLDEVEVIAVSKKKSSEDIKKVIDSGHISFGENQLQEVEQKWINLKKEFPKVKLHFIGGIQSKKVKSIFEHCDVIHSVDRIKIVQFFAELEAKTQKNKEYFIQINIGNEEQKGGIRLSEADEFISNSRDHYKLNVIGLMCLPPLGEEPKKYFTELKSIADRNNLACLSMGMSNDYDMAIACGATHIRIGTQIFGPRN